MNKRQWNSIFLCSTALSLSCSVLSLTVLHGHLDWLDLANLLFLITLWVAIFKGRKAK